MARRRVPCSYSTQTVNRWIQLCAAIIAMMAIANLQYAWTLFTKPLTSSLHATLAAVQIAFAAFILCEPGWYLRGYLIDRLGPRLVIGIGGLLVGAGWIGSGYSMNSTDFTSGTDRWNWRRRSLWRLTGNVLKWFPDAVDFAWRCVRRLRHRHGGHRGPIDKMIRNSGYQHTFIFGLRSGHYRGRGCHVMVAPQKGWLPRLGSQWRESVKASMSRLGGRCEAALFYLIYIMMALVAFSGLVVTSQLKEIALLQSGQGSSCSGASGRRSWRSS